MGRPTRVVLGDRVYPARKRAHGRQALLTHEADDAACEQVRAEAVQRVARRVLAYGAMPNHWPLVRWPPADGDLSRGVGWLPRTQTQRWHAHHPTTGTGHLRTRRDRSRSCIVPFHNSDKPYAPCAAHGLGGVWPREGGKNGVRVGFFYHLIRAICRTVVLTPYRGGS
jgi:hypothetical protein